MAHRPPKYALFILLSAAFPTFAHAALPSTTLLLLSKTPRRLAARPDGITVAHQCD